ncbi:hypothetical protein SDC9_208558 [bioreactor metagenome]|uniref:Uncharacterized protein n=1 Tax=bioreactor metagenome TaxID=1076179 RepID=A0A645JBK2_9ZZZZ
MAASASGRRQVHPRRRRNGHRLGRLPWCRDPRLRRSHLRRCRHGALPRRPEGGRLGPEPVPEHCHRSRTGTGPGGRLRLGRPARRRCPAGRDPRPGGAGADRRRRAAPRARGDTLPRAPAHPARRRARPAARGAPRRGRGGPARPRPSRR